MKVFKKVLLFIAILLLVISAIGLFFFPGHIHVERSVVINQSPSMVYNYAGDLKNYQQWSPWYERDTTATYTYSENTSGQGAKMSWVSNVKEVGKGDMTVTDAVKDSMIAMDLKFVDNGVAKATYLFSPEGSGTKMIWAFDFEAGKNPLMRIMGKFMDGMVGPDFEKGLNKLKSKLESMPAVENSIPVEEMKMPEMEYMFVHGKANMQNIGQFLGGSYMKIGKAMAKQNLTQLGAPFAIYYTDSPSEWELDAAIPVSAKAKDDGEVKAMTRKEGNALRAKFFGPYEKTSVAYASLKEYIKQNNKVVTGAPWESYVTDPMVEKDTAKWQTDVCFPIQ